jgi:hypothetical protein
VAEVRRAVAAAARAVGRDPTGVRIVAVTKTLPPSSVRAAIEAGIADIGENYVQEAQSKRSALGKDDSGVSWHLIGRLQRNKVRAAVACFDRVHAVDTVGLAAALGRAAAGRRLPVLIQVNVAAEVTKQGVAPEDTLTLAQAILAEPALVLEGLMTVPPPPDRPEASRIHFRTLRDVRDTTAKRLGVELPQLSMGMSDDFTVAVEEGATWLRLGRVLFGARGPAAWRAGLAPGGEGS